MYFLVFIVMLEALHIADLRGGIRCGRQWHGVPSGTRMVGLGTLRTSFEAVAETSAGLPYGLLSDRR